MDVRYDQLPNGVPRAESLAMVCDRLTPLWEATIEPALQAGRTVLVVGHGNTLRALIKRIDGVSDEGVYHLDMPTAIPLLYEFDGELRHLRRHGLWSDQPETIRHGRYLMDESHVRAAQDAMRKQVRHLLPRPWTHAVPRGPLELVRLGECRADLRHALCMSIAPACTLQSILQTPFAAHD